MIHIKKPLVFVVLLLGLIVLPLIIYTFTGNKVILNIERVLAPLVLFLFIPIPVITHKAVMNQSINDKTQNTSNANDGDRPSRIKNLFNIPKANHEGNPDDYKDDTDDKPSSPELDFVFLFIHIKRFVSCIINWLSTKC